MSKTIEITTSVPIKEIAEALSELRPKDLVTFIIAMEESTASWEVTGPIIDHYLSLKEYHKEEYQEWKDGRYLGTIRGE